MNQLIATLLQPSVLMTTWEVICLLLFWSVFCRSLRTSIKTRLDIRLSLWLVGVASLFGLGAPLYGWVPNVVSLVMVGSVAILQIVMSKHWKDGVPYYFLDPKYQVQRRAGDIKA